MQIKCLMKKNKGKMEYGATAHNRTVYASPPVGGSGFRFARSLRSHAQLHPHFCKPWKPTVSFIGLAKTSYTAGRYVQYRLKFIVNI
jgi:hypothetical protein